ncbi:HAD-superfamily subfamily IIA hydrolase [Capronia epimyces CBS 606.96]|uniref:HAD-superfamily subfamily IIA hydrolase n=1 Tax=Capronia epimyces CBS 606.96 TaxID=1182542 RepID=W9XRM9_9EURO|nr:HAD-superfamily subfamily IIA hydrolase [Capronia epimyces CBS 606.96]EXJ79990.1 HAD-superfamily subfamily IIA hydrolase [Capronia epimyces CBS 606.96]
MRVRRPGLNVRPFAPLNVGQSSLSQHLSRPRCHTRAFQSDSKPPVPIPDFAFAFDIDGVLLRSAKPIPHAAETLQFLQRSTIPFILLTNGGGKHESERVQDLSSRLSIPLDTSMFVQSHTPFAELVHGANSLKNKCILVVGGEGGHCRDVAEKYGFTNVVTPADIYMAHPEIWPFGRPFKDSYYRQFARPLPKPINPSSPEESLKIEAVFVYNDPRDWGLDLQIVLDVMLSHRGLVGTYSSKNGDRSLPNSGYLQDGQPPLYFSNPDLLWAADYHLSRLGQGGFREALEGVWRALAKNASGGGGDDRDGNGQAAPELYKTIIGKPFEATYSFAEKRLLRHRDALFGSRAQHVPLKRVYMVGDNPESDIRGATTYQSPHGIDWIGLLTRTGVYKDRAGHRPTCEPRAIVDDVRAAVQYALKENSWPRLLE